MALSRNSLYDLSVFVEIVEFVSNLAVLGVHNLKCNILQISYTPQLRHHLFIAFSSLFPNHIICASIKAIYIRKFNHSIQKRSRGSCLDLEFRLSGRAQSININISLVAHKTFLTSFPTHTSRMSLRDRILNPDLSICHLYGVVAPSQPRMSLTSEVREALRASCVLIVVAPVVGR